jgi:hypothetical protein
LDFTSHIYPADSILRAVHLVVPPGYPDWKPLKLLDLEFANSVRPTEGTQTNSTRPADAISRETKQLCICIHEIDYALAARVFAVDQLNFIL